MHAPPPGYTREEYETLPRVSPPREAPYRGLPPSPQREGAYLRVPSPQREGGYPPSLRGPPSPPREGGYPRGPSPPREVFPRGPPSPQIREGYQRGGSPPREYRGGSPREYGHRSPPPRDYHHHRQASPESEIAKRSSGCLFVGNIPYHFHQEEVTNLFGRHGIVESVKIGTDKKTGHPKGHAFVQFRNPEDAQEAYNKLNRYTIEGRSLRIDWDAGLTHKQARQPQRRPMHFQHHHHHHHAER